MSKGFIKTSALLGLSGTIFGLAGGLHVIRYFVHFRFQVGDFHVSHELSIVVGCFLLLLSFACFKGAGK